MPDQPQVTPSVEQTITEATTPQQLEVKLATGQIYHGSSERELIHQLAKAQENASTAIADREEQIRQLQQQQIQGATPAPVRPSADWDSTQYYQKWQQDPRDALLYELGSVLGIPSEAVVPTIQRMYGITEEVAVQLEALRFHARVPEFPGGDVAAQAVTDRMQHDRLPPNAEGVEIAYNRLVREGKLAPQEPQPSQEPERSGPRPAPTLGGGGGAPPRSDVIDAAWNMPMDQLEDALRRAGVKKY